VAKQTSREKPAAAVVDGAIARAADALASGGLVLIPTDTLPGLAAVWSLPAGLAALKRAAAALGDAGAAAASPLAAWHAADGSVVREVLMMGGAGAGNAGLPLAPLHGHAIDKLFPGPVTLRIERPERELAALRAMLGVPAGLIDDGAALFVRVPGHAGCRRLLGSLSPAEAAGTGMAVYVAAIAVRSGRDGGAATTMSEAADALAASKVEHVVLEAGVERGAGRMGGVVSTLVTLTAGGGWALTREGALARREVEQRMRRTVLFVCTGNTCRSPMAQAIAKGLAEQLILKIPTVFESAGTSGADGGGYSVETRHAVAALGLVEPRGTARGVTAAMIEAADVVFAMTAGHRRALLAVSPEAAGKVRLLDPAGKDIADPVGGPQTLYDSVAANMKVMLARRLEELEGTG